MSWVPRTRRSRRQGPDAAPANGTPARVGPNRSRPVPELDLEEYLAGSGRNGATPPAGAANGTTNGNANGATDPAGRLPHPIL